MREKVLKQLLAFLQNNGFQEASFAGFNSCFDIAARREDLHLLLKVLENIDSFRRESAEELQKIARVLNAVCIIVGEKSKAFELRNGLIYERFEIPAVSFETFKELFAGEIPEIHYFKGKEIVELDSGKLQALRKELNLTMQELAEKAGSSVESIYRYEQGHNTSLDTARRLEEILGKKLIKKPNILSPESSSREINEKRIQDSALKHLHSLGLRIAVFKHAPFKAFSRPSEPLMINKGLLKQEIERKALILEKTKTLFDSHSMIIAKEFNVERVQTTPIILEKELQELQKKKELLQLLKEREA